MYKDFLLMFKRQFTRVRPTGLMRLNMKEFRFSIFWIKLYQNIEHSLEIGCDIFFATLFVYVPLDLTL